MTCVDMKFCIIFEPSWAARTPFRAARTAFQWMIIAVPIAVFLSLFFIFFTNFALETHVHIVKKHKELTYAKGENSNES